MFDRLYKEANDEIPVNTELMETLLNKAAEKEKKKKKPFIYLYRYGFVAGVAAVIAVSLHAMPYISKNLIEDYSYIDAVNSTAESFSEETSETSDKDVPNTSEAEQAVDHEAPTLSRPKNTATESIKKSAEMTSTEKSKAQKTDAKESEVIQKTETEHGDTEQEEGLTDALQTDAPRILVAAEKNLDSEKQAYHDVADEKGIKDSDCSVETDVGGAGAVLASAGAVAARATDTAAQEECCDYYGFDPNNLAIPVGMSPVKETETISEQSRMLIYEGSGKRITITPDADTAALKSLMAQTDGERHGGHSLIVATGNENFEIYTIKNERGIIINAEGLKKEEIYSLVDSVR